MHPRKHASWIWRIGRTVALFVITNGFAQGATEKLFFEPYVFETSNKHKVPAEMARLFVPEKHSKPNGKRIELALVRFKCTATNPGPPIVYLAGGPGGSGIALARGPRFPLFMAMREVADVIALDQRGTGLSKPNLNCRETLDYPLNQPSRRAALLRRYQQALRACADSWRVQGVDLSAYNTEENADDIESLRRALGVEKLTLWGSSYGTHLGLTVLRRHDDRIHRAIFSGVEGPDETLKLPSRIQQQLRLVSELAKADPQIRGQVPDLMTLMKEVLTTLEKTPATLRVTDEKPVGKSSVVIGRFDLEQTTFGLLGTRAGKAVIPALYYNLSIGNYSSPFVQTVIQEIVSFRRGGIGSAMSFAMDCSSGASSERRRRIQHEASECLLGGDADFPIPDVCAACGLTQLASAFRAPFTSSVPILFLSGTFDGRTPPENASNIQKDFPNSTHVSIEGAGHGDELFVSSPQIKEVIVEFAKNSTVSTQRIVLPPFAFKSLSAPTSNP